MSNTAVQKVISRQKENTTDNTSITGESIQYKLVRTKKGTDADGKTIIKEVTILQTGFLDLLRKKGFRRHDIQDTFIFIRIEDNIIEQYPNFRIREYIIRYFTNLSPWSPEDFDGCPKEMFLEKLYRSLTTLTTDEKLSLLVNLEGEGNNELKIVEDTIDTAYYFYLNGFVEVTKKGWKLRPYSELPGYIWRDQIIQRDFKKLNGKEIEKGVYWKFANNVSDNQLLEGGERKNEQRFCSFLTITGYNLHRYFQTKLRASIFLDARQSDEPDGRSGKSLHCKALREILNADPINGKQAITIDGKKYDPNNRFNLDELHISTRLVVFDDIKRGFHIEDFFNSIVDGLVRERKGDVNKVRIFSKIIFTLNYTIQIRGGSAKDRVIEFEFADYYSSKFSPEDEFEHWFFRDWDKTEFNRFDNFMMLCVCEYLKCGVIEPSTLNLEARKLKEETAPEFINFMEDLSIEHEKKYDKKKLYSQFLDLDDNNKPRNSDFHWLKQRLFTKWLQYFATYRPEIAGYKTSRSNGTDFIQFIYNDSTTAETLKDAKIFPEKANRVIESEGTTPF